MDHGFLALTGFGLGPGLMAGGFGAPADAVDVDVPDLSDATARLVSESEWSARLISESAWSARLAT